MTPERRKRLEQYAASLSNHAPNPYRPMWREAEPDLRAALAEIDRQAAKIKELEAKA